MDVWGRVVSERRRVADRIDGLDPAALDEASWCEGWRVRDVLGHLVYLAEATQLRVARDVLRHGPLPDRALAHEAKALGALDGPELTARLRRAEGGRFHVLGSPAVVALGELLVHGADMFRPLGHDDPVDPDDVAPLLPVYRRVGGLAFHASATAKVTLVATDAELRVGSGPVVEGRAVDLLLLLANRRQVLASLEGPGLTVVG